MPTYFVSGHLDLTLDEFREHYAPAIWKALEQEASFVVGDARGCDLLTQLYLRDGRAPRVRVFHMLEKPRNNVGDFPTVGGFPTDEARDAAMTEASDADIAWVRPARARSQRERTSIVASRRGRRDSMSTENPSPPDPSRPPSLPKFRRDSDERICCAPVVWRGVESACLRRAGHDGDHAAVARDAAIADGVCHWCRVPVGAPHRTDCKAK